MLNIDKLRTELEARPARSAWSKGVKAYAFDLLDEYEEARDWYERDAENVAEVVEWMLNGAQDWKQYSWGGSSLCYDGQIAARLCNPSELKKTQNGNKRPNAREEWLDCQARALYQAAEIVKELWREAVA